MATGSSTSRSRGGPRTELHLDVAERPRNLRQTEVAERPGRAIAAWPRYRERPALRRPPAGRIEVALTDDRVLLDDGEERACRQPFGRHGAVLEARRSVEDRIGAVGVDGQDDGVGHGEPPGAIASVNGGTLRRALERTRPRWCRASPASGRSRTRESARAGASRSRAGRLA